MIPGGEIDSSQYERKMPQGDPLPLGVYSMMIVKTEQKPSKNDGIFVEVEFDIKEPQKYIGRKFWDRFNIVNASAEAMRIAKEGLADLATACGIHKLYDDEHLCGKEVIGELYIEEAKPYVDKQGVQREGKPSNKCRKYWPLGTNVDAARAEYKAKQKFSASVTTSAATGNKWPGTAKPASAPAPTPQAAPVNTTAKPWKRNA
jgi:hypothetical protein